MLSNDELRNIIESELDDLADDAVLRGEGAKPDWEPEIDSHAVLSVCIRIEEETGIVVSEDVVPVGGFADRETCVREMMRHAKEAAPPNVFATGKEMVE